MDAATAPTGATQAPTSNTQANGANGQQTPAKAPPPATVVRPTPAKKETTAKHEALGRGPDGKYLPKQGNAAEPPAAEPEPFRFKHTLKSDGQEEEVNYSKEELVRELQLARTARKRLQELAKRSKELDDREARFKSAPHEVLKEFGVDPDEWATQRLAQRAQDGLMSPEERAYRELESKHQELQAQLEARQKQDEERESNEYESKMWEQEQPQYLKAMEEADLPRGADVMGRMADVGLEFLNAKIPLSPEQIVRETAARLERDASRYLLSLPTETLMKRLGPDRIKAINAELNRRFHESQSRFADNNGEPTKPAPEDAAKPREFLSGAEVDRRARAFAASLKK